MTFYCWKCSCELSLQKGEKLSFRAHCDKCDAALHCCANCKYYKPGLPNDCAVPGTEKISDRQKNNFCEEFSSDFQKPPEKNDNGKDRFASLFK